MELPKELKIGGFQWSVEEHKDVAHEGNVFGSTHTQSQKFFIEPDLAIQKRDQTLLHEIMHAIWWQSGLGKIYNDKEHKEIEENVVHGLSMGLYQVLKDNKLSF